MSQKGGKKTHDCLINWAAKTENQQASQRESILNREVFPETARFTDGFKFFRTPHREASHGGCDYLQISLQKHVDEEKGDFYD